MGSNSHPTSTGRVSRRSPQANRIQRFGSDAHLRGNHADLAPPATASSQVVAEFW
tara:strand:- start:1460 stop:1624 length:165 start_codon:yes stop_codon:yes gene_type:complete